MGKWPILRSCAEELQRKTNYEAEGLIKKLFQSEPERLSSELILHQRKLDYEYLTKVEFAFWSGER